MTRKMFTLIELLIVISIIAILAAMLLPALSRVKYKAKLVVCMNNQKQIATGATLYASENSGRWPHRGGYDLATNTYTSGTSWSSSLFCTEGTGFDDRPLFKELFPINETQCPFPEPLDLANFAGTSAKKKAIGGYGFHFGWKYVNSTPMVKMTENMVVGGSEFDIIVYDFTHDAVNRWARSAHPDYGTNSMQLLQGSQALWSRYLLSGTHRRGPVDLNFTRKDGSVFGVRSVKANDPRMKKVPYNFPAWNYPSGQYSLVPDVDFSE